MERIEQAGMPGKADKRIMEKIYIIEDDENIRNLLKIVKECLKLKHLLMF